MEPSPKRLEAILQIPNLLTIANPLRRLTYQDAKFVWRAEQQQAFDKLKQHLSEQPVIAYFYVNRQTGIVVDPSPVGLGGILAQFDEEDLGRVIAYASRALTDVEWLYT